MIEMAKVAPYDSGLLNRQERQRLRRIFKVEGCNSVLIGLLFDRVCEAYRDVVKKESSWLGSSQESRKSLLFTNFSALVSDCGGVLANFAQASAWAGGGDKPYEPSISQKNICEGVKIFRKVLAQLKGDQRLRRLDQAVQLLGHTVALEYHTLFRPPTLKLESIEAFVQRMHTRISWIELVLEKEEQLFDTKKFPMKELAERLRPFLEKLRNLPKKPKEMYKLVLRMPPWLYGSEVDAVKKGYRGFIFGAIWSPLRSVLIESRTYSLGHLLDRSRQPITEQFEKWEAIRQLIVSLPSLPSDVLKKHQWPLEDRRQLAEILVYDGTWEMVARRVKPFSEELLKLVDHADPIARALPLRCLIGQSGVDVSAYWEVFRRGLELMRKGENCSPRVKTLTMQVVWNKQFAAEAIRVGRSRIIADVSDWFDALDKPIEWEAETRPVRRRQVQRPRKRSPPKPKRKEPAPPPKVGKIVPPTENLLEALPASERLATERMQAVGQYVESLDAVAGYRLRLLLVQAREILQHDLGRHYEVDTCRRVLELLLKAILPEDLKQNNALFHTHHLKNLLGAIVDYPELASNLLQGLRHYGWLFAALSNANAALFYPDIVGDDTTLKLIRYIDSDGPASYLEHTLCAVEELLQARKDPTWTGKWTDREIPAMTVSEFDVEEEGGSVSTAETPPTDEELVETPLDAAQKCLLYVQLRQLTYPQPALDRASIYLRSLIQRLKQSNRDEMLLYTVCGELSLIRRLLKEVQVAVLHCRGQLTDELCKKNNPLVLSQHLPDFSLGGLEWLAAVHQGIHYPKPRDGCESRFREHLCQIADTALAGHGFTPAGGKSPRELIEVTDREYLFPALSRLQRLLRCAFQVNE